MVEILPVVDQVAGRIVDVVGVPLRGGLAAVIGPADRQNLIGRIDRMRDFASDIQYSVGQFTQWPEGTQK